MNESLEQLRKAVKTKAPKLDEQTILNGIAKPNTSRNLSRRLTLSGMAVAGVVAIGLSVGLAKPTPLFALSNSAGYRAYSNVAGDAATTSDKMMTMMPAINYEYLPGDSLSWMGGTEKVYELKPAGDPIQLLRSLAARFGIEGEILQDPYDQGVNTQYSFGEKGRYDLPSVGVSWSGTGGWYVNLYQDTNKGPGYLSDEKYKLLAQELFAATGLNLQLSDLTLYKDYGRRVVANLRVDGKVTPIEWNMSWDEHGNLIYASGNSVQVIDRGFASTISEREAVKRISDWRYSGFAGGLVRYGAADDLIIKNLDENEPKTETIKVTDAENKILELWDKNGATWLVPGYTFKIEGLWWTPTVFSLVDGLIELPDENMGIMY